MRDPKKERILKQMGGLVMPQTPVIELPIDDINAFDYENADKAKYGLSDLNQILADEIMYFRKKNESRRLHIVATATGTGTTTTSTGDVNVRSSLRTPLNKLNI